MDLISLDALVARERECSRLLCEAAGVTHPGDTFVSRAMNNLPELSPHWRFVSEGISQFSGLKACQTIGIKLYGGSPKSASEKGREDFVTSSSLIYGDLSRLFLPTDLAGRPFNLALPQQVAWSAEQGGEGLAFAPEALFLWARCALEEKRPLWAYGTFVVPIFTIMSTRLTLTLIPLTALTLTGTTMTIRTRIWAPLPGSFLLFYLIDLIQPPSILPIS